MIKKQMILLLLIMMSNITVVAQIGKTFKSEDSVGNELFYKIITENTVMLLRNEKAYSKMTKIIIPENVRYKGNSYQVTEIEPGCFRFLEQLETVIIPETIKELKSIEEIKIPSTKSSGIPHTDHYFYGIFSGCHNLKNVSIPNSISVIEQLAFSHCEQLIEVSLPLGLSKIGGGCFCGCSSLRKVSLPLKMTKIEDAMTYHSQYNSSTMGWYDSYHYGGFFEDCIALTEIEIPSNVTEIDGKSFYGCKSLKKIKGLHSKMHINTRFEQHGYKSNSEYHAFDNSGLQLDSLTRTFSYYAEGLIRDGMKAWQQKKEFETVAQYQSRVTNENREKKLKELIEQYRNEYIRNEEKAAKLNFSIGSYDSEYNVFPITEKQYGTKYVKVQLIEAKAFKDNFSNAIFHPTFGVVDNNLAIIALTVNSNGKSYNSEQASIEDKGYDIAINLGDYDLNLEGNDGKQQSSTLLSIRTDNTLDINIPTVSTNNTSTFAVIIGNERYTRVAQVPYANNDAKIFADYCKKTLGVPEQNVRSYENATYGTMLSAVEDIKKICEAYGGKANVIFYYAGHGIPDETTKDAFLLPVDADGMQKEACYSISRLYKELGNMKARYVVLFMDACFSGSLRGEGMLASARGVALKAKTETPQGNMVVFSAATSDETAYPYKEKGHGLFTYYLLKKLQESKGDCTLGDLGDFIQQNVRQQSVVVNRKSQTPTVVPSANVADNWREIKLR